MYLPTWNEDERWWHLKQALAPFVGVVREDLDTAIPLDVIRGINVFEQNDLRSRPKAAKMLKKPLL
jgi:hypothetical protein